MDARVGVRWPIVEAGWPCPERQSEPPAKTAERLLALRGRNQMKK
jgi:hypothetical protein